MNEKCYTLAGCQTQLVLQIGDVAEIVYYGRVLRMPLAEQSLMLAVERPVPYGRLDQDVPVTLSPQLARGSFGAPGIEGHRHGQAWAPALTVEQVIERDHSLTIISRDATAQLALSVSLTLDDSDVLQMCQTLTNEGRDDYCVTRLANTLPLPERADEVMSYYGRWVHEFQQTRTRLTAGGWIAENRRGRTSHEHFPALMAGPAGFGEITGEVWGAHLGWSGNHRMRVDVKADGRRVLQAEALYLPGEIVLNAQQSLSTPVLYVSYSDQGLNGMSQHFHRYVREHILGNRLNVPRPVHLNTWEGIYFHHDPAYIRQMAVEAAELGVERFIIDDGWFKGRNDDTSSLGDWVIDENKYPQGLSGLIDEVHQLGMQFGLWFEPEMVNKNSDLYRQHPDWLLAVADYDAPTGRHQYVLDLQNDAVFDYLLNRLDNFLSSYAIDYIKWDMNREVVQPAHEGRAAGVAQVWCLYRLIDTLCERHPQVDIESCASGGGRIDFEILKRTHRFWASDNNDALERTSIQRGMSYFFPPEVMGSHIGAGRSHTTRRTHSLVFRGLTALFGHLGLELDPVTLTEAERIDYQRYVRLYKQWRGLLHSGITQRLVMDDSLAQQGMMVVDSEKRLGLILVTQVRMPTYSLSGRLRLPGLAAEENYRVTVLQAPAEFESIVNHQPRWTRDGVIVCGEGLMQVGLAMPVLDPESALLIEVELVDKNVS